MPENLSKAHPSNHFWLQSCNSQDCLHKAVYSEAIFWGESNLSMNNKQSLFIWIETLTSPPLSVCRIQCVIAPTTLDKSQ